jgi:hypothetical protein
MELVYQHAYVTLCTPTSSPCLEGFLARPSAVEIKFCSRLRSGVQGFYILRYQRILGSFELTPEACTTPQYLDIYWAGTWMNRAWTSQEQHLSTRRLYFDCSRIHLHCSERELTEPGIESDVELQFVAFRGQVQDFKQGRNRNILFWEWNELVHDYSSRQITHGCITGDLGPREAHGC